MPRRPGYAVYPCDYRHHSRRRHGHAHSVHSGFGHGSRCGVVYHARASRYMGQGHCARKLDPTGELRRLVKLTSDWGDDRFLRHWHGSAAGCGQVPRFRAPSHLDDWPNWLHRCYPRQPTEYTPAREAAPGRTVVARKGEAWSHAGTERRYSLPSRFSRPRSLPRIRPSVRLERCGSRMDWLAGILCHDHLLARGRALFDNLLLVARLGSRVSVNGIWDRRHGWNDDVCHPWRPTGRGRRLTTVA